MIREAIRYVVESAINPNLNNINVVNNPSIKSKIYSARNFIVNLEK